MVESGCGYPFLELNKNERGIFVRGELYEIDEKDLDILDELEGYPTLFKRYVINVKSETKEYENVLVYVKSTPLQYIETIKLLEEY